MQIAGVWLSAVWMEKSLPETVLAGKGQEVNEAKRLTDYCFSGTMLLYVGVLWG